MINLRLRIEIGLIFALLAGVAAAATGSGPGGARRPGVEVALVKEVRTFETELTAPVGITASPAGEMLFVVEDGDLSAVAQIGTDETDRGYVLLEQPLDSPNGLTYDARSGELLAVQQGAREIERFRPFLEGDWDLHDLIQLGDAVPSGPWAGFAVDSGREAAYVLHGRKLSSLELPPDTDSIDAVRAHHNLSAALTGDARGLAVDASTGFLYVGDPVGQRVLVLDPAGDLQRVLDLAGAGVHELRDLVVAASSDGTDALDVSSLYVVDDRRGTSQGGLAIMELSVAAAPAPAGTEAATRTATQTAALIQAAAIVDVPILVQTIDTAQLSPSSPDSAGITWMPAPNNQLLMSDSEINEYNYYEDVNLWQLSTQGAIEQTGTTLDWSHEPTGVAYDAAGNRIFTTDDNRKIIYEVDIGADRIAGTNDDVVLGEFDTIAYGNTDPEGITYDINRNWLHVADGSNREVFSIDPGPNGIFEGGNDDIITHFDVFADGVEDPEGITHDPINDTLAIIDYKRLIVTEFTISGAYVRDIDISASNAVHPAGGTWAPSSTASGNSLWIVDRGIDGSSPRDGKLYEFAVPGGIVEPAITVIPASLAFGSVGIGLPVETTVTVANVGTEVLQVSSSAVSGDPEFSVISGGGAVSVAPGGSHDVEVRFDPSVVGPFSGTLTVSSNDPGEPTVDVPLSGDGVPAEPDINISPASVEFGFAVIGAPAQSMATISNLGTSPLQVSSSTVSGDPEFSLISGGGPVTLQPGESQNVVVQFLPGAEAAFSGLLSVASNDPDEPTAAVALSGDGVVQPPGVSLEALYQGGSSAIPSVATSGPVTVNPTRLYLAFVAAKSHRAVTDVSGLGGTWTPVGAQCGARNATGVSIWQTTSAVVSGVVSATLSAEPTGAVIAVAEYSGVDLANPIGTLASANTNGLSGACSGGTDTSSYALPLTTSSPVSRVVGAVAIRNRSHEPGVGWVEQIQFAQGSGGGTAAMAIVDQEIALPGPIDVTGTFSSTVDWAIVAVEIRTVTGAAVPEIAVSPPSVAFGPVAVGSPVDAIVTVSNVGTGPLQLNSSSASGDPDFSVVSGGGSVALVPGASHEVVVRLDPSGFGSFSGTLTVSSDDPDTATVNVPLSGNGVVPEPEIAVSPLSLPFGLVPIGSPAEATVTVSNLGTAPLQLSSSAVTGDPSFSVISGGAAVAVAPGGSHDVVVRFDPSVAGSFAGTLTVASNDLDEPTVNVSLSGDAEVAEPDIDVSPASLAFGSLTVGSAVTSTVTVSNVGTAPLELSSSAVSGDPEFSVTSGGGAVSLPPGESHNVAIEFLPGTEGPFSGLLTLTSDDPDEPTVAVALSGDGVLQPPGVSLEATYPGGSAVSLSVATSGPVTVNPSRLYLAFVASKSYRAVTNVSGLGATWTPVAAQCGGRNATGMTLWRTTSAVSSGVVSASFDNAPSNAAIVVAEYSGVDLGAPIGAVASANTNGASGACSGGTDASSYSLPLSTLSPFSRVIGAVAIRNRSHEPGIGWVEQIEFIQGSGGGAAALAVEDQDTVLPGPLNVDGSFSSTVDWAAVAVEVRTITGPPVADISVSPSSVGYGPVSVGSPVDATVTISNVGTGPLQVSSVSLSGDPEFSLVSGGGAVTLQPGQSQDVVVEFLPGFEVFFSGILTVASDDSDEATVQVALSGEGVVQPPGVNLGATYQGGSTSSASVATSGPVAVNPNRLYVAFVASKSYKLVTGVSGLGASWTQLEAQCSGRNATGVTVWSTTSAVSPGIVSATFSGNPKNAVIAVAEYSGVDLAAPIGAATSANTNGLAGACSGGTDTASYAVPLTTTSPSSLVVGAVAIRNRGNEPGVGWVERLEVRQGSGGGTASLVIQDQEVASPTTVTLTGAASAQVDWAAVAFELQAD